MRALLAALLVAIVLAAAALADRETAQFQAGRGDKALLGKKWDEAETCYRKALEEDATFLQARYGLAQALIGGGKSQPAVEELRKFLDEARALTTPPAADLKALVTKAEKQLGDLDAAGAALQKIVDNYVDDLVALAARWQTKDPALAENALRRAMKLKPGYPKAAELLTKMGKSAAGEATPLFDGTSFDGWEFVVQPTWQVADGAIVGAGRDAAYNIRTTPNFEGNYDIRLEMKLVEAYPGAAYFCVMPCWKADYDHYNFGVMRGKLYWADETAQGQSRVILQTAPGELKKSFDVKEWNTFEIRFRGNEVTCLLNGDVVGKEPRPEGRRSGFIGLRVQDAKVAFRNVQVEPR